MDDTVTFAQKMALFSAEDIAFYEKMGLTAEQLAKDMTDEEYKQCKAKKEAKGFNWTFESSL